MGVTTRGQEAENLLPGQQRPMHAMWGGKQWDDSGFPELPKGAKLKVLPPPTLPPPFPATQGEPDCSPDSLPFVAF